MSTLAIIGSQWGDEGKGKIIDYLAGKADMVVRSQGGSNAGHTVVIDGNTYALHMVPSGILSRETVNIIGNGVAFDIRGFFDETEKLSAEGIDTGNIFVSDRAHIVFPYHRILDTLAEKSRGSDEIGTTGKGIGPCYMDKIERSGIRTCDVCDADKFREKLSAQIKKKNEIITGLYDADPLSEADIMEEYTELAFRLRPFIVDTGVMIDEAVKSGKKILFEGAQGSMLDIDLGTYPYVTSSHPTSGGFTSGSGIGAGTIKNVLGITKAYTTRVGKGPFVTELDDATGDAIRNAGNEFGTTTGRPRRCGWFDAVVVKYSARINGTNGLALMLLDVLGSLDEIKICISYECENTRLDHYPASLDILEKCIPVYVTLPGWKQDISDCRTFEELPDEAKAYIECIEKSTGVDIDIISVGAERNQTIIRKEIYR